MILIHDSEKYTKEWAQNIACTINFQWLLSWLLHKCKLSVTNYSLENNLPTFRLNAPVVIRAKVKEVRTNITIYSHTLLRIHIIGGQRLVRIAPPSLPPHHSDPAARDFQSSILVEALSSGCAGPPSPTAPVLCCGPALWSPPSRSDGDSPTHAPLQLTSPSSPSRRHPMFLQSCLQFPFGLTSIDLATAAGDTILDCEVMYPSPWSTLIIQIAHPDDTLRGALQLGWRTGSPWLLNCFDEEAGREEQSSPTFDLQ